MEKRLGNNDFTTALEVNAGGESGGAHHALTGEGAQGSNSIGVRQTLQSRDAAVEELFA